MTLQQLARKAATRARWESYVLSKTTRRWAWQLAGQGRAKELLRDSVEALAEFPPTPGRPCALQSDDMAQIAVPARSGVYRIQRRTLIEADHGYPIVDRSILLSRALPRSSDAQRRSTLKYFSEFPSLSRLWRAGSCEHLPRAITLRHVFEYNYFHVILELLLGLVLIDENKSIGDTPILIGKRLWAQPYFHEIVARDWFSQFNWIVQDRDTVVDELIFAESTIRDTTALGQLRDRLSIPLTTTNGDRLFLGRTRAERRQLLNWPSIEALLARHGYRPSHPGSSSFQEQLNLFAGCPSIVAIHGAALTNIALAQPGTLDVVELLSPNRKSPLYWELAMHMDHRYRFIVGSDADSSDSSAAFSVNIDELDSILEGSSTHGSLP